MVMNTYTVAAWPGAGNFVHPETVRAESEEKALKIFCRRIIDKGFFSLYSLPYKKYMYLCAVEVKQLKPVLSRGQYRTKTL